jgi:hypothetical protein
MDRNSNNNHTTTTATSHLWQTIPNLPSWLKDYMDWHHDIVTQQLTAENKYNFKYLVLRCYRTDERCGGVSDRLKPIPLLLLAAARSSRLLFIHWDRPFALEEFLQPVPGGFNWSVPMFLEQDFFQARKGALTRAGLILERTQADAMIQACHLHGTYKTHKTFMCVYIYVCVCVKSLGDDTMYGGNNEQ